jgi:hypothetical protein
MRCRSPSACSSCHPMTIGNDRSGLNPRREARSPSGPGSLCSVRECVAVAPFNADGLDPLAGAGDEVGVAADADLRPLLSELSEHLNDLTAEVVASSLSSLPSAVDRAARTDGCGNDMAESVREGFGWEWSRRPARRRSRVRPNLGAPSSRTPPCPSPSVAEPRASSSHSHGANGSRRACRSYETISSGGTTRLRPDWAPSIPCWASVSTFWSCLTVSRREARPGRRRVHGPHRRMDPQKWGTNGGFGASSAPGRKKPPRTGFPH